MAEVHSITVTIVEGVTCCVVYMFDQMSKLGCSIFRLVLVANEPSAVCQVGSNGYSVGETGVDLLKPFSMSDRRRTDGFWRFICLET